MSVQAAVAQWKREHKAELISGNCKCLMTLDACKKRQASRKNYEIPDDDESAIAYEFMMCDGNGAANRCPYFAPTISKRQKGRQCFTRSTPEGIRASFASVHNRIKKRKVLGVKPDVNNQYLGELYGKLQIENPKAFAWRAKLGGGRWKI